MFFDKSRSSRRTDDEAGWGKAISEGVAAGRGDEADAERIREELTRLTESI